MVDTSDFMLSGEFGSGSRECGDKSLVRRVLRYTSFYLRTLIMASVQIPEKTLELLLELDFVHLESLILLVNVTRGKDDDRIPKASPRQLRMPRLSTFTLSINNRNDIARNWRIIQLVVQVCDRLNMIVLDDLVIDSQLPNAITSPSLIDSDLYSKSLWTRITLDSKPVTHLTPMLIRAVTIVKLSAKISSPYLDLSDDCALWVFALVRDMKRDSILIKSITQDSYKPPPGLLCNIIENCQLQDMCTKRR
jgi:hypothetical protein